VDYVTGRPILLIGRLFAFGCWNNLLADAVADRCVTRPFDEDLKQILKSDWKALDAWL
jgi:hypothetical protein